MNWIGPDFYPPGGNPSLEPTVSICNHNCWIFREVGGGGGAVAYIRMVTLMILG